jgi:hypothetical protein
VFFLANIKINNFFLERSLRDEVPLFVGLLIFVAEDDLFAVLVVVEVPDLALCRRVDVPSGLTGRP